MGSKKWVPIPGYESVYEISKDGQLKLTAREVKDSSGKVIAKVEEKLLEPFDDQDTHKRSIILHDGSKYGKYAVEDLVKLAFN